MSFILNRLCQGAEELGYFMTCKQEECSLKLRRMVRLYVKKRWVPKPWVQAWVKPPLVQILVVVQRNAQNKEEKQKEENSKVESFLKYTVPNTFL